MVHYCFWIELHTYFVLSEVIEVHDYGKLEIERKPSYFRLVQRWAALEVVLFCLPLCGFFFFYDVRNGNIYND